MHLNTNLRIIRTHLGYSQQDFAERLNLTRSNYNHYERNVSAKLETVIDIARELRVSLDTLILDDCSTYSLFKMRQMLFPDRVITKVSSKTLNSQLKTKN